MARAEKLDNPEPAKTEEEVYPRLRAWMRELDEVSRIDKSLAMADRYKVLAVKNFLVGKVKKVVEDKLNWTWGDLLRTVQDWSLKAHIENRDMKGKGMDTNNVEEPLGLQQEEDSTQRGYPEEEEWGSWGWGDWGGGRGGLDALSQGKGGKGKGYGKAKGDWSYYGNNKGSGPKAGKGGYGKGTWGKGITEEKEEVGIAEEKEEVEEGAMEEKG